MMADEKQTSAPMRRRDQKLRWESSDTNLASSVPRADNRKVKFQDGCVFLAACSSGDREEVKNLLERGADINTSNVDGLTALHQACIDDNLDMVEFLVELGADVDVCDNEGWTPLHATSSCAFTEIARYLIKQGANVAAVNNDGDLPYDIAENKEMENFLQEVMNKQGIDADAARCEEEERMLEDANAMLQDSSIKEQIHPKTGASPLHVASAKGYLKVMNVLLRANVDINAEDVDGWTALHAAVHWGQEDACKVLIEHFCDMMHKNHAGHTAFDLAEKDMRKLLEELRETQANMRDKRDVSDIIISSSHGRTRRSSVTRMSVDQKQNVIQRNLDEERAALAAYNPIKENTGDLINNIAADTNNTDDSETERKNERNKQVSQQAGVAPSNTTSVELRRQDSNSMPKIDEVSESDRSPSSTSLSTTVTSTAAFSSSSSSTTTPVLPKSTSSTSSSSLVISDSMTSAPSPTTTITSATTAPPKPLDSVSPLDRLSSTSTVNDSQPATSKEQTNSSYKSSLTGRDLVSRSISVPAKLPTHKDNSTPSSTSLGKLSSLSSSSSSSTTQGDPSTTNSNDLSVPSWRHGLRKMGSTSMVHERMLSEVGDNPLPRSASSPRLALDARLDSLQERLAARRPYSSTGSSLSTTTTATSTTTTSTTDTDSKPERNSYTFGQSFSGYKSTYGNRPSSSYISAYQSRRDTANAAAAAATSSSSSSTSTTTTTTTTTNTSPPSSSELSVSQRLEDRLSGLGDSTISTTSSSRIRDRSSVSSYGVPSPSTSSTSSLVTNSTNSVFRRSYEPPKRDEETETQRKARAKHARQTRRSTQGVSLDDIEKAEQELKSNDVNKAARSSVLDSSSTLSSSTAGSSVTPSDSIPSGSTSTTVTTPSSSVSSSRDERPLSSSSFRRRMTTEDKDKNDLSSTDTTSSLRSSHRRARHDVDSNSIASETSASSDLTSNYIPRSQRNSSALLSTDGGSSSQGVARSSSFRSSRLRNGDSTELSTPRIGNEDSYKKDKDPKEPEGGKEEKKELHAIRARRQRRERRSTGIVMDNEEEGDKSKESKSEEEKKDEALAPSRYSSRFGSNSDVPSTERSQRPVSYSDFSRSTGSLDIDYKKKYEDEKIENSRLRKELEETKSNLRKAKDELDAAIKQKDASRNAERDKRTLDRKISELEEELKQMEEIKRENQKLKNDNRALTRVVARLSK